MEMQEKKLKRFNVYAIIAKVLFIITIVGGALSIVGFFISEMLLLVKGPELLDMAQKLITRAGYNYIIPVDRIPHLLVITAMISVLVGIVLSAYVFKSISRMFKNIVNTKTPFHTNTIKSIKNMGIALFIFAGVQAILSSVMSHGAALLFDADIFSSNFSIKWSIVGFGILLLALAEMFEYGASLQQDSSTIV